MENDDNDLTPLEDRKPGSSQIFDSFEISSSDMKVNSPRFFKKSVVDSGDDNKSSEYDYAIDLFGNRGTDLFAEKDPTSGTVALEEPPAGVASKKRKNRQKFTCSLCRQTFTQKHNLKSKTYSADLCCAFADEYARSY